MQINNRTKVVFKDYCPNQILLLPPSLEEMIEPNHPVRVVNQVIDSLDIESLINKYKGGGCSSYHPRLLLKVLVYGYLTNQYSSRKIEQALSQNIHFMWLSGMSYPDHNTINRFRSDRLKGVLKEVFSQVVLLLVEKGVITLKEAYLDGTKIEANANRYTFVWGRSIKKSKERIKKQLGELWSYAESVAREELENNEPGSFEKIDQESVLRTIESIDKALNGKHIDKKVKQKLGYARKNWTENLKKYEQQEKTLGNRNSYSKTDPDATFMRMKEDHMLNGQLKPGYNWQISTENQYILGYTIHQTTNDTTTLQAHLESLNDNLGKMPDTLVADAGYGSEENYEYLENNDVEAFVKYPYFHKEQSKKWKDDPYRTDNLPYDDNDDSYTCPMGQKMNFIGEKVRISDNGFRQANRLYQAQDCKNCPVRETCNKSTYNRRIEINPRLNQYKSIIRKRLTSERGIKYRSKRPVEVEAVFGMIKGNRNYRKFLLRGLEKVEIEVGLLALAHNLNKIAARN
ncbi:MAG: IS1182 family transposase [Bacteroidales bacterium]